MDCSPPGYSVQGILQARILEWVAIRFSRGSSWPKGQTQVFSIAGRLFTIWATRECSENPGNHQSELPVEQGRFWVFIFLAVLGLHCCVLASPSCAKWGLLSSCGAQASHRSGFSSCRAQSRCPAFNSCGTCVQLPRSMWDPPRPGITSMSPALGGGFLSTKPPREPRTVWWVLGCSRCPEDQAAPLPAATLAAPEECGTWCSWCKA